MPIGYTRHLSSLKLPFASEVYTVYILKSVFVRCIDTEMGAEKSSANCSLEVLES